MSDQWSDWIEWNGGECPLTNGTEYTVRLRGGLPMDIEDKPEELDWRHGERDSDIIAYCYKLTEPSCIAEQDEEEGLQEAYERMNKQIGGNKYTVKIKGILVDVYDVLAGFNVNNPATAHAVKKMLKVGDRGYKDKITDLRESIESLERAIELERE